MQINVKVQVPVLNSRNTNIRWTVYNQETALENGDPLLTDRNGGGEPPDSNGDFGFNIYETEYEQKVAGFQVAMDSVTYLDIDGALEASSIWRSLWFKLAIAADMEQERMNWVHQRWERKGFMKGDFVVVPTAAAAQTSGSGTGIYF
jgi:hypothetical protein